MKEEFIKITTMEELQKHLLDNDIENDNDIELARERVGSRSVYIRKYLGKVWIYFRKI